MIIIPKGILAQYLNMRIDFTHEETIRRMTYVRPVKEWLMAGNYDSLEDCIEKCECWRNNKWPLEYNFDEEHNSLEVKMQHVDFKYNWIEGLAWLRLDKNACVKLGWTETEYMLKGRFCCNMDRVFSLNERLDNAIELPAILEWYEQKGVLQQKKEDFKALCNQLDWWSHVLNMFCLSTICFFSTKKLKRREVLDDLVRIECHLDGSDLGTLYLSTNDTSKLDNFIGERYLPWLKDRKKELEEHLAYLKKGDIFIPTYSKETQPEGFDRYFEKEEIVEAYRPVYDLMYETAIRLSMADRYDGTYFYFWFNTNEKPYKLLIHLHCRTAFHDLRFEFSFKDSDWEEDFQKFWQNVKEKAIQFTQNSVEVYTNSIRVVSERLKKC